MEKLTQEQADVVRKLCDAQSAFEYWCHELTASKNRGIEAFVLADKERIIARGKEIRELQRKLGFNLYHDIRALVAYKTDTDIGE